MHDLHDTELLGKAIKETIGRNIRNKRQETGFSQTELATLTGMSRSAIANIEDGKQNLMVHQFVIIFHILRLSPTDFISGFEHIADNLFTKNFNAETETLLAKLDDSV